MRALDDADVKQLLKDRLDSREWWVLIPCGASKAIPLIESRHYWDDASSDFQAVLGGDCPVMGFYFAKKTRMSPEELADIALQAGVQGSRDALVAQYQVGDIVGFGGHPQAGALLHLFGLWLEGKAGIREQSWEELSAELTRGVGDE
jgi:hypothetical protein